MKISTDNYTIPKLMKDIYMSYYGREACPPGHLYGPAVRDHHLYVFVTGGRGVYTVREREYPLVQGQAFILFPHELTMYRADSREPWEYMWFGFDGRLAGQMLQLAGIDVEHPVMTHERPDRLRRLFAELFHYGEAGEPADELFYTSALSGMLAEICRRGAGSESREREPMRGDDYVELARNFMEEHYDKSIAVTDVASYVGLERSYLTKLFKAKTGLSPYEHIMSLRIARGKRLLRGTDKPIEHIALLLGFKDMYHFSGFFKRKTGMAPLHYRKAAAGGAGASGTAGASGNGDD